MHQLKNKAGAFGVLIRERWSFALRSSPNGSYHPTQRFVSNLGLDGFSSAAMGRNTFETVRFVTANKLKNYQMMAFFPMSLYLKEVL